MKPWMGLAILSLVGGCSEATGRQGGGGNGGVGGTDISGEGRPLAVEVPADGRAFVELTTPAEVTPPDSATSTEWDLAFERFDIFTNSGPSGPGDGGAFGPLPAPAFLGDEAPDVPFITQDETGGAFLDWYLYDGTIHALWSRYHVYGVRDGDRLWKVQILSYYGEQAGAPVSALYQLRYAEVTADGAGPTETLENVDGTAGGPSAPENAPSECLDLGSGQRILLTPEEARQSYEWHLCFRRETISVNGELGGPRGVTAVDLDGDKTAAETLEQVQARTAESELPRFEAAGMAALTDDSLVYRGDRIVSAFSDRWFDPESAPAAPAAATWLVVAASGSPRFLVAFERFDGPTGQSPGTVHLRVKPVQ